MFRISNNKGFTTTNDTHDIYDIFLGFTGDEDVSKEAWVSASQMCSGDKKEVAGYLIEQFDETKAIYG